MTFGHRVRELRTAKKLSLRALAPRVGVGFTYLSKVENGKLDFGDYPSETLIRKLAVALDADETELLILAEKIPELIRRRFIERPDVFGELANPLQKVAGPFRSEEQAGAARRTDHGETRGMSLFFSLRHDPAS